MNKPRFHLATDVDSNLHKPSLEPTKARPSQNLEVTPPTQEIQPTTQQPESITPTAPVATSTSQRSTSTSTAVVVAQPQSPQAQQVHTDSATAREMFKKSIDQLEAEDVDLIEEPWVKKTEEMIEKEKDDPSVEDEYQNHINSTYLKKRFNLDVN